MNLFGSKKSSKDSTGTKMKVRIVNIKDDCYICAHVGSNFKVKAKCKANFNLEIGQIVMIKYDKKYSSSGYLVVDDLSEELDAEVLAVHHIISNDELMYTSLIIRNPKTNRRMHSLVSNNNKLFSSSTNTIIVGDHVKLKINNGAIFKIQNCSEEAEINSMDTKED